MTCKRQASSNDLWVGRLFIDPEVAEAHHQLLERDVIRGLLTAHALKLLKAGLFKIRRPARVAFSGGKPSVRPEFQPPNGLVDLRDKLWKPFRAGWLA